jgi:MFS family permease
MTSISRASISGSYVAANFFSGVNPTAAFIFTLLGFAAGFAVRPFGALFFGSLGDLIGRKYTFLVTMTLMGISTFVVGLLPSYAAIGFIAPVLFIACRLIQGLALGGEYGGAATYVAEHAPQNRRGYYTSWIQTTATVGLFLSLIVVLGCACGSRRRSSPRLAQAVPAVDPAAGRIDLDPPAGGRPPSSASGRRQAPRRRCGFRQMEERQIALLALFGGTAGQATVWYCGQSTPCSFSPRP